MCVCARVCVCVCVCMRIIILCASIYTHVHACGNQKVPSSISSMQLFNGDLVLTREHPVQL